MPERTIPIDTRGGGWLSTGFGQPRGSHVVPGAVRGYHIDMRIKARGPRWPDPALLPLEHQLFVDIAQWGLGAFEHYLADGCEEWLAAAESVARDLVGAQVSDGPRIGGWVHPLPYPHTFPLAAGWMSAMAQGEAASLLVRVHAETGDDRFAEAALLALRPFVLPSAKGGVLADLDGGPFYEEYPTEPGSFVLNGAIFALFGCYDVAVALNDPDARALFDDGVAALATSIGRWDTGWWSRYDLFPHRLPNVASTGYHELHVAQLLALDALVSHQSLRTTADRFASYNRSRVRKGAAFAAKVAFRLAVPGNLSVGRLLRRGRR